MNGTRINEIVGNIDGVMREIKSVLDGGTVKEIGRLRDEHAGMVKEQKKIRETIEGVEKRLKGAKEDLDKLSGELGNLRRQRQDIQAEGGDPGQISLRIKSLRDKEDEVGDLITGLSRRLEELRKQDGEIPGKLERLEIEVVKSLVVTLGRAMDIQFAKVGEIAPWFIRLRSAIPDIREADNTALLSTTPGGRHFEPPLLIVPRILFRGESGEDYFHEDTFREGLIREGRERLAKWREEARQKVMQNRLS